MIKSTSFRSVGNLGMYGLCYLTTSLVDVFFKLIVLQRCVLQTLAKNVLLEYNVKKKLLLLLLYCS